MKQDNIIEKLADKVEILQEENAKLKNIIKLVPIITLLNSLVDHKELLDYLLNDFIKKEVKK